MTIRRKWVGGFSAVLVLATLSLGLSTKTYAAALPGRITALPNPPGAPQRDVFLITFAKAHAVPARVVFHFKGGHHKNLTVTEPLKKLYAKQYETLWAAPSIGHLNIQVFSSHNQLLAQAVFPVAKAKTNVIGRILIGAIFIGVSLWFWWRQQRFYRQPH